MPTSTGNQQEYEFIESFKEWFLWQHEHIDEPTCYAAKFKHFGFGFNQEQGMVDKIIDGDPVRKSGPLPLEWNLEWNFDCYVEPSITKVVKYLYHKFDFS